MAIKYALQNYKKKSMLWTDILIIISYVYDWITIMKKLYQMNQDTGNYSNWLLLVQE